MYRQAWLSDRTHRLVCDSYQHVQGDWDLHHGLHHLIRKKTNVKPRDEETPIIWSSNNDTRKNDMFHHFTRVTACSHMFTIKRGRPSNHVLWQQQHKWLIMWGMQVYSMTTKTICWSLLLYCTQKNAHKTEKNGLTKFWRNGRDMEDTTDWSRSWDRLEQGSKTIYVFHQPYFQVGFLIQRRDTCYRKAVSV